MGALYLTNPHPNTWPAWLTDKRLKPKLGGERLYHVEYGTFDDGPQVFPLTILIRESIYEKLCRRELGYSPRSKDKRTLVLTDKDGNEVPHLEPDLII